MHSLGGVKGWDSSEGPSVAGGTDAHDQCKMSVDVLSGRLVAIRRNVLLLVDAAFGLCDPMNWDHSFPVVPLSCVPIIPPTQIANSRFRTFLLIYWVREESRKNVLLVEFVKIYE